MGIPFGSAHGVELFGASSRLASDITADATETARFQALLADRLILTSLKGT